MKLQLSLAICVLCLCSGSSRAGQPSNRYLPPHRGGGGGGGGGGGFAARTPSNQYLAPQASNLHYHGVSGAGHPTPQQQQSFLATSSSSGATRYAPQRGGAAGVGHSAGNIPIVRQYGHSGDGDGSGNYNFGFEAGNGIKRDETGEFNGGWPHGSLNVMGSYSYTGDDGKTYTVNYRADSNGFHAEGDHIPKVNNGAGGAGVAAGRSAAGHGGGHVGHGGQGGHGGHGGHGGGVGGHYGAASAPSKRYLPPSYRRRRHYKQ